MRYAILFILISLTVLGQTMFDPAITLSGSSLRNGLAAYWRLEEGGTTRYDCSKNGNHLTSNNGGTNRTGKVGLCATNLSASSQYLSIASNSTLVSSNLSFTLAFWACPQLVDATTRMCIAKTTGFTTFDYYSLYDNSANGFVFAVSTNGTSAQRVVVAQGSSISANTWYFVVCWYDSVGKTINIKVNNGTTQTVNDAGGIFYGSSPLALFATGDGVTSHYMNGALDEVGIWHRVLTASEITFLYNSGAGTHFPWAHP